VQIVFSASPRCSRGLWDLVSWLIGLKQLEARALSQRRHQLIDAHRDLLPLSGIDECTDTESLIEIEHVCERLQLKPRRGKRGGTKWEAANMTRMNRLGTLKRD
jgi:hypothetical protein